MNQFRTFALLPFLLFALFAFSPFTLSSQTTGKEFWICIPPNERDPYPTEGLEICVASDFDTEITVTDYASNRSYKRTIKAGEIRMLSDARGETNWTWEVRDFEQAVAKGIRITAPRPISVWVLNSKVYTTDGFRAFPTTGWGTNYIVAAYYDFKEFQSWAGGFCIVAKEPTTVKIKLQGVGGASAKTSGGKSIGDSITVLLDEGEVYAVCGDGSTRGVFDLTGTIITSTKPVGVFGFHQRTTMPNVLVNGNGRNHLVEALPPTYQWGKKYVTTEFSRSSQNEQAKGDMFRVIASEPNTRWVAKSYNLTTKQLTINAGGLLTKAGDFTDLTQSAGPTIMPNGFTVIEADKPILVVQYSNSSSFDGDVNLDPFMIVLVPVEQFLTGSVFATPRSSQFSKHFLNVIAVADTTDPDYTKNLQSVTIDNAALTFTHMGNGLHWATKQVSPKVAAHRLTSNGKVAMSGFVYGYGAIDAYGWPIASATRDLGSTDTMPPLISGTTDCGTFTGKATETRNIPNPPRAVPHDSDQVETGIAEIDTVYGANSYNYSLSKITSEDLPRTPSFKQFDFKFQVIDPTKPAYCVYYVQDWANNITYDTLRYAGLEISSSPETIAFGETRLNVPDTINVTFTNNDVKSLSIDALSLQLGTQYALITPLPMPHTLQPGESVVVPIQYRAGRETQNATTDHDLDTLLVDVTCGTLRVPVSGVATQPLVDVEDYNADYISPGIRKCKTGGLLISNNGTDTLVITGFTGYEGTNFAVTPQALSALPYIVLPKSKYQLRDVCYQRMDEGTDSITVTFQSNASGPKPTSIWKARTTVTSVEEDAPTAFNITATAGTITASWQGAGVSRMIVSDLQGRKLGEIAVPNGESKSSVNSSSFSSQMIIVALVNDEGSTLYSSKLRLP